MARGLWVEYTMKLALVGNCGLWLGVHLWLWGALAVAGCGSTTSGGGGGFAPDVAADLSLSFGGKDAATGKDSAKGNDAASTSDLGSDDAAVPDDIAVDDTGLEDATDSSDQDVLASDVKDTVTPKDTVAKDTVAKDTGSKDISTADVSTTCGNGTCGAGETCENCAVDCPCTPCNPLTSTGCKATQQCYVATGGLQCGGFGKVAEGGTCQYLNDCALGSMCVGGICRKICATAGTSMGCSAPADCQELADSTGPLGYNLGACFAPDNCNLITSSGCPSGQACFPASNGKQCGTAGKVGLDGVCKSVSDCAAGFLCLNNGATSGTCKKRCDTTDASTCPTPLTCGTVTIGDPPALIGENFGVCDTPPP